MDIQITRIKTTGKTNGKHSMMPSLRSSNSMSFNGKENVTSDTGRMKRRYCYPFSFLFRDHETRRQTVSKLGKQNMLPEN